MSYDEMVAYYLNQNATLRARVAELEGWHEEWKRIDAEHRKGHDEDYHKIRKLSDRVAELEGSLRRLAFIWGS